MSRYMPTADGAIAFVGSEMVLIIERPAAVAMLADIRRWTDDQGNQRVRRVYASMADDLARAIESSEGHDGSGS